MLCNICNYFFSKKSIDKLEITKNNIEKKNIETINDIETINNVNIKNDVNIKNGISIIKNYNKITDIYCVYMSKKNFICINKTNIKDIILFNSTNQNILYIIEYINIKYNIQNLKKYDIKNL